jgi:hypothetical protein
VCQTRWHIRLAEGVIDPSRHGAVIFHRQDLVASGGNRNRVLIIAATIENTLEYSPRILHMTNEAWPQTDEE